MRRLLHDCTLPGYPPDYLLARIHGRMGIWRSGGVSSAVEGSTFQADDSVIWDAAARERRWVYMQMETDLRDALAPLLFYLELNALILWLRSLEAGQQDSMVVNLEKSLLSAELKKKILSQPTPGEVVAQMERFLANSVFSLNGLAAAYDEGGVQRCEELIWRRFFGQVPDICSNREVSGFFRTLIDLKNTLTIAKCLRWKQQDVPPLIKGGHVRLLKAAQVPSEGYLEKIVQRQTGGRNVTAAELQPVNLEQLLFESLAKKMARQMRSASAVGCCVAYIWLCFVASRRKSGEYHRARFVENFPFGEGGEK